MQTRSPLVLGLVCLLSVAGFAAPPDPTKVPPELAKAKLAAARKVYETRWKRFEGGLGTFDPEFFSLWSHRWREAQREASTEKPGQVVAAQEHLERMKKLETIVQHRVKEGAATEGDAAAAAYYRIEAEIALVRAKAR
ncbi:MAG: hypothetical protein HYS12_18500 [Planctomycetes bacterium]|nr:hypothetical protein [Planctomycetota bacterium]